MLTFNFNLIFLPYFPLFLLFLNPKIYLSILYIKEILDLFILQIQNKRPINLQDFT